MPYVQRNKDKVVVGLFANKQSGYAEEFLAADHADVVSYLAAPSPIASKTERISNWLPPGITLADLKTALK